MRSPNSPMRFLLIAAAAVTVSGCQTAGPGFPSAADLTVKPKPVADASGLTSEAALDRYETELFLWGEEGWLTVGRLCRFHKSMGMKVECPPPERLDPG